MESDHESDCWSDAPELDEDVTVTTSLFSPFEGTPAECLADDRVKYGWSMEQLNLGPYDFIKLVNYSRAQKFTSAPKVEDILVSLRETWDQDKYFKPTMEDDPFLMYEWDNITRPEPVSSHFVAKTSQLSPVGLTFVIL